MRCAEATRLKMIGVLKELGVKSAETLTEEEAVRMYSKMRRRTDSYGVGTPMTAQSLAAQSAHNRRRRR